MTSDEEAAPWSIGVMTGTTGSPELLAEPELA
jgi:hypothetical protein